jgi:hypothetical protein
VGFNSASNIKKIVTCVLFFVMCSGYVNAFSLFHSKEYDSFYDGCVSSGGDKSICKCVAGKVEERVSNVSGDDSKQMAALALLGDQSIIVSMIKQCKEE